jgi:hypothetical protein
MMLNKSAFEKALQKDKFEGGPVGNAQPTTR